MTEAIKSIKEDIAKLLEVLEIADHPPLISKSLVKFAEDNGLSSEDVIMLSKINYRGKVPETVDQWAMLYVVIRNVLGGDYA
jgi:hypothetical protein